MPVRRHSLPLPYATQARGSQAGVSPVARRPAEPAPAKQPIHSAHETNGTAAVLRASVAGILWLTDTRGDIWGFGRDSQCPG